MSTDPQPPPYPEPTSAASAEGGYAGSGYGPGASPPTSAWPHYGAGYAPYAYSAVGPVPVADGDPRSLVQFRNIPGRFWLGTLAVLFGGAVTAAYFNQFWNYFAAVGQVAPFVLIALFAYLGKKSDTGIYMSFLTLALFLLAVFGGAGIAVWVAGMSKAGLLTGQEARGGPDATAVITQQVASVAVWGLAGWVSAMLAALPAVRQRLSKWFPIDPDSPVHAAALALVCGLTLVSFGQLIACGGRPALLTLVQGNPDAFKESADDLIVEMALTFLFVLPASLTTVGWPIFRSIPEALERLGMVKPTARQVIGALVTAVAMVFVFRGLDWALNALWDWTHWPRTDGEAFDKMMKPLFTPQGALLVGITAGIQEELMIRGALQPRLGILLPNLFFTGLHAFQYGFDGLISVFAAGLVLGVVRKRSNTTCSAITHGTYDFILVLMSWYVTN